MVKFVARIAPVLVLCCGVVAVPPAAVAALRASAPAAPRIISTVGGYAWSAGDTSYEFSTTGTAISVSNLFTGDYHVTFSNQSVITGGIVQVTSYDSENPCVVGGWSPSDSDLVVQVLCYSLAGSPAESRFDVIVTQAATTPGTFDYSFVYKDAASATLIGPYQFNSAHKHNSVRHLGTGRYQVTFGGPASSGMKGTVKVSAYGAGGGDCAASGWRGTSKGQVIGVHCYAPSGSPVNRRFVVTYAARTNLMALPHHTTANALIGPTGHVVTQFDSRKGARVTVRHSGRGRYQVHLNGTPEADGGVANGGDVQVSPVTGSPDRCMVVRWLRSQSSTVATINCFGNNGNLVNSEFAIQFVAAVPIA